jgi:hypothetical protein
LEITAINFIQNVIECPSSSLSPNMDEINVCIGKHLSGSFPIRTGLKQGDALSQLL